MILSPRSILRAFSFQAVSFPLRRLGLLCGHFRSSERLSSKGRLCNPIYEDETITETSVRTVSLPPELCTLLKDYKKEQEETSQDFEFLP